MALEQKLSLKLTQKLVMTPSLQQAIKLLQMTRLELEGVLTQELVENPVLEEGEEESEETSPADGEEPVAANGDTGLDGEGGGEQEPEVVVDGIDHNESMSEIDLDVYFNDYLDGSSSAASSSFEDREAIPIENTLTREPDLYDHLLWQLHMSDAGPRIREIAEQIIGNLNPDGFLVATLEEIQLLSDGPEDGAAATSLEEVKQALRLVQSFDPIGVACDDLQESLLRQLEARDEEGTLAYLIIRDSWDLFLKRQFPALAKAHGISLSELEPAVDLIRSLETRPGRRFTTERTHYVEPDVAVVKVGNEYVIQLNDDGLPRLRVSRAYRRMLQKMRSEGRQSEAQAFIKEKIRSAIWLIKSLDQRQRTIYKVADSIVRQQRDFLDNGIDHLRPMVLRDVAEDIAMHESTVSRVVANKYIHTPRGLFPMKFFFHSGIDREYGEDISSLTVKRKIQHLIQGEDTKRPLSDSELMRVLNREGINIARRTVAKYRDELGIPSSTDRKRFF